MKLMKNRRSLVVTAVLAAVLLAAVAKAGVDAFYRMKLPHPPDLQNLPAPLSEQIASASKKARLWPSAKNIGNLGMVYHSAAFYDQAASAYMLAARKNKSEWTWPYYLGYLNQEMGESNSSIENFRKASRLNDRAFHAWYYTGKGYQNLGEDYKAEVSFRHIVDHPVKSNPENNTLRNDYFPLRIHAMYSLSRIYAGSGREDQAEKALKEILNFHRSFGPAYKLLGDIYRQRGDQEQGDYFLTRANDLVDLVQPVDTLIDKLSLLSRSAGYILKQVDEAERALHPDWSLRLLNHGLSFYPEDRNFISKAIKIMIRLDRGNEAGSLLNKHIVFYKDDFKELKETGDLLAEKGLPMQAMIYFNQALNLNPDDLDCRIGLISCIWNSGMSQDAIKQIDQVIEKNKGNSKAENELVSILIRMGEKEKAASYLTGMSRSRPADPGVRKLFGMLAEAGGDLQRAKSYYVAALRDDPADFPSIRYLGNILIRQGSWNEAIIHFKKALEQYPNNPFLLERLGTLLVSCPDDKLRNYGEAKEYSERAFINNGCPAETLIASAKSLAEAYAGLGDKNNATTFMNIAISLAQSENYPAGYIAGLRGSLEKISRMK